MRRPQSSLGGLPVYQVAVFLSAFLLFQVQPIASKALLPGFGGSYLVWGACMVFFQFVLMGGYIYAHAIQRWLGVFRYSRAHWLILLAPLLFFPFNLERLSVPLQALPLSVSVFLLLLVCVGLPFFTLSTTSLLLQKWLSASGRPEARNPYVLYSASNLGSMTALLSYPVLVEPFFSMRTQNYAWWAGYALLVVLHVFCMPPRQPEEDKPAAAAIRLPPRQALGWFLLSAASCAMLLSVSNVLTFDVASVPFLWVLPLSVYLLTFVLAFKSRPWMPDWMRSLLDWAVATGIILFIMTTLRLSVPIAVSILLHLAIMFVVCLNCASRLIRTKPSDDHHLTTFYVVLSAGGLTGSLMVNWVAPVVSSSLVEYPLSFCLAGAALALTGVRAGERRRGVVTTVASALVAVLGLALLPWAFGRYIAAPGGNSMALVAIALPVVMALRAVAGGSGAMAAVVLAIAAAMTWTETLAIGATSVARLRNYYGIYRVYDLDGLRYLQHGTTQHGRQYLSGPKRHIPLAYFHPSTPAARVLKSSALGVQRIGMIGLGTGALVSYAGQGQTFTVYELDEDNLRIAEDNFTYLEQARQKGAELRFVFGDGRVSLGREPEHSLDLIIIDAFNSGSIPVHLLTVEAFEQYFRTLKPGGLLLLHVSNKVLQLEPVVYSNAASLGLMACESSNELRCDADAEFTYWMAVTARRETYDELCKHLGWWHTEWGDSLPRPWTDQYCNVFGAMFRREAGE